MVSPDLKNAVSRAGLGTILLPYAQRYVWWKTPEQAVVFPYRVIGAVMDKGDWDDVVALETALGHAPFRKALEQATAGQFRPKSWHFWHKRLFGAETRVPKQPERCFP